MRTEAFQSRELRLIEQRLNDILRDATPEDIFDIKYACVYDSLLHKFSHSVIVIFKE